MAEFSVVVELPAFKRDKKFLTKKFRSLDDDLKRLIKNSIVLYHKQNIDSGGIFRITGLGFEHPPVYKVKKFACQYLKYRGADTGLRLIYAYFKDEDRIELIELYKKEKQGTECDKGRVHRYYSS